MSGSVHRFADRRKKGALDRLSRRRSLRVEKLENRQLLAADSIGVTPLDTGEFLLGSVTVTPVFFESDGRLDPSTQDWTETEIEEVLAKITEGVNWWGDLLDTKSSVHSLDFVVDPQYAENPFPTIYEPIDRTSQWFSQYVGDFLTAQGYGDAPSIERAVHLFNERQRIEHQTDWAFTIFVADSSDDDDGFFAGQGDFSAAFAFPGGLFMISPSTRPASTFAHEMGHIFWARDEYPGGGSWTDRRGYYNAQNLNAADNPTAGFVQEVSILRGGVIAQEAYDTFATPDSTLAMVGWRDSDNDGIFDVFDVPLRIDAVGYSDLENSMFHLTGSASAVPLMNQNSAGPQSDITLARIREIQYRMDGGQWMTAAQFDAQQVDFDLSVPIEASFSTIEWRAIDTATGVTSETIDGTSGSHVFSSGVGGYAFVDANGNSVLDANEILLPGTKVKVLDALGDTLFRSSLLASEQSDGDTAGLTPGVTLSAEGITLDGRVGAFDSESHLGVRTLHSFDAQMGTWFDRWGQHRILKATFDQNVPQVSIDFIGLATGTYGLNEGSYARVEAYDSFDVLIDRVTSPMTPEGQAGSITIDDPQGRIASIKVYGHAETEVAVIGIDAHYQDEFVTDVHGAWPATSLAPGDYQFEFEATNLIHQWTGGPVAVEVPSSGTFVVAASASRVDSPRHNAEFPEDVNREEGATALDALRVINDLARSGARTLGQDETSGDAVDVNNDGEVSALDALLVINFLRNSGGEGEQPSSGAHLLANRPSADNPSGASEGFGAIWEAGIIDRAHEDPKLFNSAGPAQSSESNRGLPTDIDFQARAVSTVVRRGDLTKQPQGSEKNEEKNFDSEKFPQLSEELRSLIIPFQ